MGANQSTVKVLQEVRGRFMESQPQKGPSPNSFLSSLQALEKLYANMPNLESVKALTFLCSLHAFWHSLRLRHTNLHFPLTLF